jgi:hypothetical protein
MFYARLDGVGVRSPAFSGRSNVGARETHARLVYDLLLSQVDPTSNGHDQTPVKVYDLLLSQGDPTPPRGGGLTGLVYDLLLFLGRSNLDLEHIRQPASDGVRPLFLGRSNLPVVKDLIDSAKV